MNVIHNVDICCGLAWGDEAKGKIVSELIKKNKYDWVCRWSGGNNAGHTIYIDNKKYATHIVPAGVFYGVKCFIGPDCFININALEQEMNYLKDAGFDTSNIYISGRAHIITDEHINIDNEKYKKQQGSTGTGIAPCARDKFARTGIQVKDCIDFPYKVWNDIASPLYGDILCEGSQGFWLDINYGEYPYVTSSNTLPYSACSLGFTHNEIRNIYGAAKVYDTRVGVDPFFEFSSSESHKKIFNDIAKIGEEYGTTTKRLRKVEWLNLDKLIHAINISGTNILIISKIDILEKINKYVFIYKNIHKECNDIKNFQKDINNIILSNCKYIEQIIYSDNPITVELFSNSNI
uniref:Adenylosuccinate synthase n=1 Tax=viral metagenome TaxID=1070528 RepID=A0A6C0BTZ9_9ZZZZ